MEAIGLLVTLEARRGKEADAEAFLKQLSHSRWTKKGLEMVRDQACAGEARHLRYLCQRRRPQCPLDWRDREGIGSASQRTAGRCPAD